MERTIGQALPLGVSRDREGINFAIEVAPGAVCKLLLYNKEKTESVYEFEMVENSSVRGIRFLKLNHMDESIELYRYEVDGEVYVDPYAHELVGREEWNSHNSSMSLHINDRCIGGKGVEETILDNIYGKLVIFSLDDVVEKPYIPEHEIIAYRLHVRGFTKHATSKVKAKGTFKGVEEKIPYLKELGVNQVQLLPSFEFEERGEKVNYWGYAPGYYMAPKSSYAFGNSAVEEFGHMVAEFHKNNMEVVLDMPFIDMPSFTFQIECLRHYVLSYQIDGFVLNPYATNLIEIKKDPILKHVKILTQQEEFQIAMRKFLKGDEGMVREAMWQMRKVSAESEIHSYNYITNHNGFTMMDLVSYDGKHNESNGEKNQDGTEYNYCWNCGAEGLSRKKVVVELRKTQIRNAWVLLMLSQGTPCILAGDEFGNSQQGNNNAYCQDNEISWIDWRLLKKQNELLTFVKELIALRKKHPVLHQKIQLQGMDSNACGLPDVSYHGEAAWITPEGIASRQLGVLYSGAHLEDNDCYIAYNMHWIEHEYALPTLQKNKKWYQVLDTSTGEISGDVEQENQRVVLVPPRTITMYISK